jgi:hypothetical protein
MSTIGLSAGVQIEKRPALPVAHRMVCVGVEREFVLGLGR